MQTRALLVALALASASPLARAQSNTGAMAEELFQQGVTALKAGNTAKACPALAESQRLDPRPGTLFALADCEAQAEKYASASAHFQDYLTQTSSLPAAQASKHADRRALAEKKLAEIKPLIPRLTLVAPEGSSIEVLLDGVKLGAASLGLPLPVDPGDHSVVVKAGGAEQTTPVKIKKSEQQTVKLLAPKADAGTKPPENTPPAASTPSNTGNPPPTAPPPSGRSPLIYVAGGVGVVGIGVGAVAGVIALGKKGTVDNECKGSLCTPKGKEAGDSANRAALFSTIGFGVGVAGLAAATVLLVLSPKPAEQASTWRLAPSVSNSELGLALGRRW